MAQKHTMTFYTYWIWYSDIVHAVYNVMYSCIHIMYGERIQVLSVERKGKNCMKKVLRVETYIKCNASVTKSQTHNSQFF